MQLRLGAQPAVEQRHRTMLRDIGLNRRQREARKLHGQIGHGRLRRDLPVDREHAFFINARIERHADRFAQVLAHPFHLQGERRQHRFHGRMHGAILGR